jgi:L-glyceraldehyde 3-phosphate reductase
MLSDENLDRIRGLAAIAERRGQSLAQMAVAWTLRDPRVTTTLLGASSPLQLEETAGAVRNLAFTDDELDEIDAFAVDSDINLWAAQSEIP